MIPPLWFLWTSSKVFAACLIFQYKCANRLYSISILTPICERCILDGFGEQYVLSSNFRTYCKDSRDPLKSVTIVADALKSRRWESDSTRMLRALRSSSRVQFTVRHSLLLRFVTCWKCGTDLVHEDFFCASNSCGVVQPVKLNNVNAFQLFHLEQRYFIDTNALEIEYKSVQKLLHPDMFASKPNDERDASNETSSTVNQAYQVRYHASSSRITTMRSNTICILLGPGTDPAFAYLSSRIHGKDCWCFS
jgi:hypothetical protein